MEMEYHKYYSEMVSFFIHLIKIKSCLEIKAVAKQNRGTEILDGCSDICDEHPYRLN